MKRVTKIIKWILIIVVSVLLIMVVYLRFSRFTDKIIYQINGVEYAEFKSNFNYDEFYFNVEDNVVLHGVLFKPDSIKPKATIFHYSGKGMHLMSVQSSYEPLLKEGFQIVCFERRNFGKSTGKAESSMVLKNDALYTFDKLLENKSIKDRPIIIWGRSLGGAFATMIAKERNSKIKGLILEGTFSSFPDIGKVYAKALNLENFKWVVPLIMNNDFPSEKNIQKITKPIVIIHSVSDNEVPFYLGQKLYKVSNKNNTEFWKIEGKHIRGLKNYEQEYVSKFNSLIK